MPGWVEASYSIFQNETPAITAEFTADHNSGAIVGLVLLWLIRSQGEGVQWHLGRQAVVGAEGFLEAEDISSV